MHNTYSLQMKNFDRQYAWVTLTPVAVFQCHYIEQWNPGKHSIKLIVRHVMT